MRRKVGILSLCATVLLGVSVAYADVADNLPGQEEIADKTPVGFVADNASAQAAQAAAVGHGGAGTTGQSSASAATKSRFTFFPDQEMPCSLAIEGPLGCGQALEPEVKTGPDGTIFVTAQEGTPAGVLAWRRDPRTFNYTQLSKPDGIPVVSAATSLTGGGGDNELAIGSPDPALGGRYRVYVSSLNSLVTNGVAVSTDRGDTWFNNPVASSWAGVDRQWLAASGPSTAYLAFHDLQTRTVLMTRTDNGGLTWGPPMEMFTPDNVVQAGAAGGGNWEGNLVALPAGGVAFPFVRVPASGGDKRSDVWVALTDRSGGAVRNVRVGAVLPTAAGIFPAIAVDTAGNLYVTATNQHGVFMASSHDGGSTWSPFASVTAFDTAGNNNTTVFPYLVAGTPGRVALAWLGTSSATGTSDAKASWTVQFAYTDQALAPHPSFTVATASNHVVHTGVVCLSGTSCDPTGNSRALAEVLQMGMTRDGRALISYPDDHAGDHAGAFAYVVEQNAGPGLLAGVRTSPPPPPPPSGGAVSTFTGTGNLPLFFTNAGSGIAASDGVLMKPGYQFDGASISGALSGNPGSRGHVGLIGYAANDTPVTGYTDTFTGPALASPLVIGGNLNVVLFVQNELGTTGATELDFALIDVAPDGTSRTIVGQGVRKGQAVVGGSNPKKVSLNVSMGSGGWQLVPGHHLQMAMTFPYLVSSTTRLYYGDATYASGITLTTG